MDRYVYALVRCVPNPAIGEFVNVAAIAGNPETGDWSVRQVTNEAHARKLAGRRHLTVVHDLLGRVGEDLDHARAAADESGLERLPLDEAWLSDLHQNHQNFVQVTPPAPMLADDAETALDRIFSQLIVDPVGTPRTVVTKPRVVSGVLSAYRAADIGSNLLHRRARIVVGDDLHETIDFAVANGRTLQLTQCWSFQISGVDEISTQVKSWAYAMHRLRDAGEARLETSAHPSSAVASGVDVQAVVAPPASTEQEHAYREAQQVFRDLKVPIRSIDEAGLVARRAADLLSAT